MPVLRSHNKVAQESLEPVCNARRVNRENVENAVQQSLLNSPSRIEHSAVGSPPRSLPTNRRRLRIGDSDTESGKENEAPSPPKHTRRGSPIKEFKAPTRPRSRGSPQLHKEFDRLRLAESNQAKKCTHKRLSDSLEAVPKIEKAKAALLSTPEHQIIGREKEDAFIRSYIEEHVKSSRSGSLYISGAPGTGKTAVVSQIIRSMELSPSPVFINCMSLSHAQSIYLEILRQIEPVDKSGKQSGKTATPSKFASKHLLRCITSDQLESLILVVLDEMDQLDSSNHDILYTLFEWSSMPNTRLLLIGIANALDLTDRLLPRLQAHPHCKPTLLHFQPYTRAQLSAIIHSRLRRSGAAELVHPMAVELCSRKISALSGDCRKALDVCRHALERIALETTDSVKPAADKPAQQSHVTVADVAAVMNQASASCFDADSESQLPLQQKFVVATLLSLVRQNAVRRKPITLQKLNDQYVRTCQKMSMTAVTATEFTEICSHLETRGFLRIGRSKAIFQAKVELTVDENELESTLKDKILLSTVLTV